MFPINFAPKTPVVLVKSNSSIKGFGGSDTTDAARGVALQAAKSAAVSGDTILIYQNCSTSLSPVKSGVNYWLAAGVTLTCTATSLIDDTGGPISVSIGGQGNLVTTANDLINLTDAASIVRITCNDMLATVSSVNAINMINGNLRVNANLINGDASAIYWEQGDCYINAKEIYTTSGYGIWGDVPDTVEGQLFVRAERISGAAATIQFRSVSGDPSDARIWIDCLLMSADGGGASDMLIVIADVFFYLNAQKLTTVNNVYYTNPNIKLYGDSHNYIKISKYGLNDANGTGQPTILNADNAISFIDIDEYSDSNGGIRDQIIKCTGGTCYYSGKRAHLAQVGDGFTITGGELNVTGVDITTQSSNKDFVRSGGTLNINSDVKYSLTKITGDVVRAKRIIQINVFAPTTNVATGDGKAYYSIPSSLNSYNIVGVHATVITAGTTGTTDIQIARVRSGTPADTLSTKLTIDSTEIGTQTAATPAVINAANDDLLTNDLIRIDVDAISTTLPQGLIVTLELQ